MPDHINRELISAYIDGELAARDRELVERALADSASLRQLHDELLEVQARWTELPRFELPRNFAQGVERRVGRREPVAAAERTQWSLSGILAAAAAVAAVLALAFLADPWRFGEDSHQELVERGAPSDEEPADGPIDWTRESLVYYRDEPGDRPQYSLVLDITVTTLGRVNNSFEDVLRKAGVPLDPDLAVDQELESTILASRMAASVEIDDGESDELRNEVQMTYVIGTVARIDDIWFRLKERTTEFARPRLDIAVTSQDRNVLRRLNESSRRRFASAATKTKRTLAHRLTFSAPLRGTLGLLGAISTPALGTQLTPGQAEDPSLPDIELSVFPPVPPAEADQHQPQPDNGGAPAQRLNPMSEALIIVRYPPEQ